VALHRGQQTVQRLFAFGYAAITVLFVVASVGLFLSALGQLWQAAQGGDLRARLNSVLESIALLTITVATLELGQTLLEEEVWRETHMSTPTRVRRFLSRFMIVIVVSLSIECLVAVFRLVHEDPAQLPRAATIGLTAAALLVAWGVFVRLNTAAERLEPEAMAQAKSEDVRSK
jgi:hypothetical protein